MSDIDDFDMDQPEVAVEDEDDMMPARRKRTAAAIDSDDEAAGKLSPEERAAKEAKIRMKAKKKKARMEEKERKRAEKEKRRAELMAKFQSGGQGKEFLDLEAEEDDEEDDFVDSEAEDDFIADDDAVEEESSMPMAPGEAPELPGDKKKEKKKRAGGAARLFDRLDEMAARYEAQAREEEEEASELMDDEDDRESVRGEKKGDFIAAERGAPAKLLPDVRDPKLWMVKVIAKGEEPQLCMQMMNKIAMEFERGIDHPIKSVFANYNLKGYLYLEAYKESDVQSFVRNFRGLAAWNVMLVPMNEMDKVFDSALRQAKEGEIHIQRNDWVKVTRGQYKGDLGRVVDIGRDDRFTVMLIPRMWPDGKIGTAQDPAPQQYNASAISEAYRQDLNAAGYWMQDYAMSNLEQAWPSQVEIRQFSKGDKRFGDVKAVKKATHHNFHIGDQIIVTQGDMKNLLGKIKAINISESERRISVVPYTDDRAIRALKLLDFAPEQIDKWFEAGNHVKVLEGADAGKTGMVCKIEPYKSTRVAVILQDETYLEVKVPVNYCEITDEKAVGKTGHGAYNIGDLVQISQGPTLACIIGLEFGKNYKVLTRENKIITISANKIIGKSAQRSQTAVRVQDDRGNFSQVGVGAVVRVRRGLNKDKVGEIMHLSMKTVWIKIHNRVQDSGFIVALTDDVILESNSTKVILSGQRKDGGVDLQAQRRMRNLEKRKGERVQIRAGKYKGMFGTIRDETDKIVNVLLDGKSKIIPLEHTQVVCTYLGGKTLADRDGDGPIKKRTLANKYGPTPQYIDTHPTRSSGWQTDPGTMAGEETPADEPETNIGTRAYGKNFLKKTPVDALNSQMGSDWSSAQDNDFEEEQYDQSAYINKATPRSRSQTPAGGRSRSANRGTGTGGTGGNTATLQAGGSATAGQTGRSPTEGFDDATGEDLTDTGVPEWCAVGKIVMITHGNFKGKVAKVDGHKANNKVTVRVKAGRGFSKQSNNVLLKHLEAHEE